jgi:hypothetical protein
MTDKRRGPFATLIDKDTKEQFPVWWPDYNTAKTHFSFIVTVRGQNFQVVAQVPPPPTAADPFPLIHMATLALREGLCEELDADVNDTMRPKIGDFVAFAISPFQQQTLRWIVSQLLILFPNNFDRTPNAAERVLSRFKEHQRKFHRCADVVGIPVGEKTLIGCAHDM